jgi:hypothetical protein
MAEALAGLTFLAALSAGDPDWDAAWSEPNPPSPDLGATGILDLIGYVRPTIVDFVTADPAGAIITDDGARYATSASRTRYLRIRISIPAGAYPGVTVREVALFAHPTIAAGVPGGQTILAPADVEDAGDLVHLSWLEPQFLSAGTAYARNVILRV